MYLFVMVKKRLISMVCSQVTNLAISCHFFRLSFERMKNEKQVLRRLKTWAFFLFYAKYNGHAQWLATPIVFFFFVNDFRVHKSRQWNYCKFVFNTCLEQRQSFGKKVLICMSDWGFFFLKKKYYLEDLIAFCSFWPFFSW